MSKAGDIASGRTKNVEIPAWESNATVTRAGVQVPMARARVVDTGAIQIEGFRIPFKEMASFMAWCRLYFED